MKPVVFIYIFYIVKVFLLSSCSEDKQLKVISDFNEIDTSPDIIKFTNSFEINNIGGHIQGIQLFENKDENYIFMTGSSDTYSYCTIVKLTAENKVVSVNRLMEKPFKHAGGFQIFQNYLAVGIEDNSLKDKSKVCVYNISEPENHIVSLEAVIERLGEPLRCTAGCIGMTQYKNKALLAVGDWDTKHIDFYVSDFDKIGKNGFDKIGTVDTQNISKEGWFGNEWHSYQNINLFNVDKRLYLIGLGQNKQLENVADLFELTGNLHKKFSLIKLASKTFDCSDDCSFKAGAGVYYAKGEFKIITCPYNITAETVVNVFSTKAIDK